MPESILDQTTGLRKIALNGAFLNFFKYTLRLGGLTGAGLRIYALIIKLELIYGKKPLLIVGTEGGYYFVGAISFYVTAPR